MTFVVSITDPTGATVRDLTTGQQRALSWEAERNGETGYGRGSVKIPAAFDQLTDILANDRVEVSWGGVRQWRGYVRDFKRGWEGDTPFLTLDCDPIAERAYACEVGDNGSAEYNYSDSPVDRAAAFETIAADAVTPQMASLVIDGTTTGFTVDRVEGTYRPFGEVVKQLRNAAEDRIVAGCDVDSSGADRLFLKPASTSADYTFPIPEPDSVTNPQTKSLGGGVATRGIVNRLRIRGGPPALPQLWPNARFDKLTGYGSAAGVRGDGVELVPGQLAGVVGTGVVTAQVWNYTADPSGYSRNALRFSCTSSDDDENDVVFQIAGGGSVALASEGEDLSLEVLVKGASFPKVILSLEYLTDNGERIGSVLTSAVAATTYGSYTTLTYAPDAPATAKRLCPKVRIRGNATNCLIGAVSLRNRDATAAEYLPNGAYTVTIDSDDAALPALGISSNAADSKDLYTQGVAQLGQIEDETVTTLAAARKVAALYFNRHAVPFCDPSFCRMDDSNPYWPGEGVSLTGVQGSALMGGAAYLPIASVKLGYTGTGGVFEQRIELKKPQVTTPGSLKVAIEGKVSDLTTPTRAQVPSPTAPGAAGGGGGASGSGGGGGGAGSTIPDGYRPPFTFDAPFEFDPLVTPTKITINEYGTITASEDSEGEPGGGDPSEPPFSTSTRSGIQFIATTKPAGDPISNEDEAGDLPHDETTVQCIGRITGVTLTALDEAGAPVAATLTFTLAKAPYDPTAATAVFADITGGDDVSLAAAATFTDETLTGWDVDFEEGDEFKAVLTVVDGSDAVRAELFLDVEVDNQYAQ